METTPQYAHVLLFACPKCMRPLATACSSKARNLEIADGHFFAPHCRCGWSGSVLGVEAVKHWVESWSEKAPVGEGIAGSCEKKVT
jgi:hypothetical protein